VIERIGGVVDLAGSSVSQPRPRRVKQPIARAQPKEFTYRDTELIEHFVDFTVILGSGARQTILDEIKGVQRDIGEVETGGRLIAQQRPKAASKSRVTLLLDAVLPGNGPVAYDNATATAAGIAAQARGFRFTMSWRSPKVANDSSCRT
jgi:hypothetical protein